MQLLPYAYAIIEKERNVCFQVINTSNPNWILNNNHAYSLLIKSGIHEQYLDKYYYNNQWYSRTWNEYTENEYGETIPVVESGYVDTPWSPVYPE